MPCLFKVDHVHPWASLDNLFTKDECKEIIKIGSSIFNSYICIMGSIYYGFLPIYWPMLFNKFETNDIFSKYFTVYY